MASEEAVPGDNMVNMSFSYTDLISGLTVGGEPLPANETELNIGDFWNLRVESVMDDGAAIQQKSPVKMTVSSRYAGTYTVAVGEYYRIGVPRPDVAWPSTMVIESVNATTYRQVEYFGPFNGNVLYFTIIDGVIDYPAEFDGEAQMGNDLPLITCTRDAASMTNVHCETSNVVVDDDAGGEDKLIMSYGYIADSGPREMYQELVKIVE